MTRPSEAPVDPGGRQYHIGLGPGEAAPRILLVGDPGRVERAGRLLSAAGPLRRHREYASLTGEWQGVAVTVLGTGIGPDNTEIALVELARIVEPRRLVVIRAGSSGAVAPDLEAGDLVVSTGAVRLETTSLAYVHPGFPALAHHEVIQALAAACRTERVSHRVGLTATAPGFYGAQGRAVPGLPLREPDLVEQLAAQGVLNMEMECSCLFTLAALFGMRAGAVCAVFAQRRAGVFLGPKERAAAEERTLKVALRALAALA